MHTYLKRLLFSILLNLAAISLWSQVWPGDVNNNGVVNNVDWLYLSHAFGEAGVPRPIAEMGIEWGEKTITSLWGTNFPGTTIDYVFGDCNGDGFIDEFDFAAIESNFLEEHGVIIPDEQLPGLEGSDPGLFLLEDPTFPFPQGGAVFLELFLGTEDLPVSNFSGISFDIVYDPDIIKEIFFIPSELDEAWGQYDLSYFQEPFSFDEGSISIAFSTFGTDNIVNGSGLLGQVFIVIEDDVLGMIDPAEIETSIFLENVVLLGTELELSPVVNDTLTITVVENPLSTEEFLAPETVEVFPNPTYGYVDLKTKLDITKIEIFNTIGNRVKTFEQNDLDLLRLDLSNLSVGLHLLKIHTDKGVLTKKVVLLH